MEGFRCCPALAERGRDNTYVIFVIKTNYLHYLSLIYFVNQPVHVSGMFIAHHQEVFTVYVQQLVRVICLS
jgi:hypothetical protein